jgi:hypothetical protein
MSQYKDYPNYQTNQYQEYPTSNYPTNYQNYPTNFQPRYHEQYNNYQTSPQQPVQFMVPPFFEDMLKQFFQEQVKLINTYKDTIERVNIERDKAMYQDIANREKLLAMKQIKTEQEKIKNSLGFYPFDNKYNQNIEEIFDNMIDTNLNKQKREIINNRPIKSAITRQQNDIKPDLYPNHTDVNYMDFRSKYEDLTQSIMTNNNDELKQSLAGFSKFVKIEPEQNKLIDTWREEQFKEIHNLNETEISNKINYVEQSAVESDRYEPHRISYTESMSKHRKLARAKSASNPPFEFFRSQNAISLEQKDNTLYLDDTQRMDMIKENNDNDEYNEEDQVEYLNDINYNDENLYNRIIF